LRHSSVIMAVTEPGDRQSRMRPHGVMPGRLFARLHRLASPALWYPEPRRPHIATMDDPIIRLYPEADKPGIWKWEILLKEEMVANGKYLGSSEHAFSTAYEALLRYQREIGKIRK